MHMKTKLVLLHFALLLVFNAKAIPDFAKSIQYKPPPNYGTFELNHDPGDNPFSGDGPGFFFLSNDQNSQITFQIGIIGFSIGKGKVVTFQRVGPGDLKKYLDGAHRSQQAGQAATLQQMCGLDDATWTGQLPVTSGSRFKTVFLTSHWIQIETNIVLKITATAHDPMAFVALTNSLHSLKIDKAGLLKSVGPKRPSIGTSHLDSVDVGYMQWRGRRTAAFVFRGKDRIFSFAAADSGDPQKMINTALDPLTQLANLSQQRDALRAAVVNIGRIGNGPRDYEIGISFLALPKAPSVKVQDWETYNDPALLRAWECWTNQLPAGFQEFRHFNVNASLIVRKED